MRYALSDYIMTITIPRNIRDAASLAPTLSIGGEGSFVGSISVSQTTLTWQTTGDATGSWVHRKHLSRVGTASLSLNMVSSSIVKLTKVFNLYFDTNIADEGIDIVVSSADSKIVATCTDCYIQKVPDISFTEEPGTREWQFTCGIVNISQE